MNTEGKTWKFGDHVNTDDIIAARYLHTTDEKELGSHCMETIRPEFAGAVKAGDIIVAGDNFGCGSSREHAPIALKACGVSVIIAKSFARIFLRNAINVGLPIIEIADTDSIAENDILEVDFDGGVIVDVTKGARHGFMRYPAFLENIIQSGGLMQWVREKYIESR